LSDAAESAAALEAVCKPHNGRAPDAVFACAGSSKPMFFMDMTPQDMQEGMVNGYWVQAWTAMVIFAQFKIGSHVLIIYVGGGQENGERGIQGKDCARFLHSWLHVFHRLGIIFSGETCT
jgi:hypothetical protein